MLTDDDWLTAARDAGHLDEAFDLEALRAAYPGALDQALLAAGLIDAEAHDALRSRLLAETAAARTVQEAVDLSDVAAPAALTVEYGGVGAEQETLVAPGANVGSVEALLAASREPLRPVSVGEVDLSGSGELGDYRHVSEIARGGMGAILRAFDPDARRAVALKVMQSGRGASARELQTFLTEAQLTAQLEHPNIVPIHEVAVSPEGELFFAMKLVRGRSLAELLRAEGADLPLPRLLEIVRKVCDGIAFAHSKGAVHRDLKPDNVMVGAFGEVLVMDWGLARVRGAGASPASSGGAPTAGDDDGLRTRDGAILGTPAYMAPEQARGEIERVDERSDIYALGAILYEALTLTRPYSARSPQALLRLVARGELEPPRERAPGRSIPRELEAVVLKAMAADPARRYADVGELRADLDRYLDGQILDAASYTPLQRLGKWVRRHRALCLGAAAVVLAALGVLVVVDRTRQARLTRQRDEAAGLLEQHAAATRTVLADWRARAARRDPSVADEPEPIAVREARIPAVDGHLRAIGLLSRVLAGRPGDDTARALRRQAGEQLARLALAGGDLTLARQAFAELADHDAAPARVAEGLAAVDRERTRRSAHREARLRAILDDLRRGLDRPDRAPDLPLLDDHVLEALGYRHTQTVAVLGEALDGLTARAAAAAPESWTDRDRQLARFLTRVLGRLRVATAVEPLTRWADAVEDAELKADAAVALCLTGRADAVAPVHRALAAVPAYSPQQLRIERHLPRLPLSEQPRTAEALARRARMRLARGDLRGALADYEAAIAGAPQTVSYRLRRAAMLAALGRQAAALTEASALIDGAGGPVVQAQALLLRAQILRAKGDRAPAIADLDRALALDAELATAWAVRGALRREAGQLDEAIADLSRAIALAPGLAEARGSRANAYEARGDAERAVRDWDRALALDPRNARYRLSRARCRGLAGDPAGALRDADRAIELAPRNPRAYAQRAQLRLDAGDHAGAIADVDRALALGLDRARQGLAHYHRGVSKAALGDRAGAAEDMRRAGALGHRGAAAGQARLLSKAGDHRGALAALDAQPAAARDAGWYFERHRVLEALGRTEPAGAALDRAIALAPIADYLLARAKRRMTRDPARALADLDRAIARDPGRVEAHGLRATVHARAGELAKCLADHGRAIELAPARMELRLDRALSLVEAGRFGPALADADHVLKAPGPHADGVLRTAHLRRADALRGLDRPDEAGRTIDRALALGDHAESRLARGGLRLARGDARGALADFERAVALAPRDARAHDGKLAAMMRLGGAQMARALPVADALLALDADNTRALHCRGMLLRERAPERAVVDLRRLVSLVPRNPGHWFLLGDTCRRLKRFEEAAGAYGKAIALDPGKPGLHYPRAHCRDQAGDAAGALADARLVLARPEPNWRDDPLMLAIASRRALELGEWAVARDALARHGRVRPSSYYLLAAVCLGAPPSTLASLRAKGGWMAALSAGVEGKTTPARLLARARQADTEAARQEQLCEAHAFLGLKRELAGDVAGARRHYRASVATGVTRYVEYGLARQRLARLPKK